MPYGILARFEPVRTALPAAIQVAYSAVGTAITIPVRQVIVQNLTDQAVMFSINGVDDHFPLASNSVFTWDVMTNKIRDDGFFVGIGTQFYVKRIGTPTTGAVYISTIYAHGD